MNNEIRGSKEIISIDLEFNKRYEPLSFGYMDSNGSLNELYFKHETDYRTYNIHGIPNYFLNKYGKNFSIAKNAIFDNLKKYKYVLGFNISNDFRALKIKKYSGMYDLESVIDLESIINVFNIQTSLFKLASLFNIKSDQINAHTALYDSIMNMLILNEIIRNKKDNITREELLSDFAKVTKMYFYKNIDRDLIEDFKIKYNNIFENININNLKLNFKDENIKYCFQYKHFSIFFNAKKEIIYKIPNSFIREESLVYEKHRANVDENFFIGYRFPIKKELNDLFIKKNLRKWSFF